MLKSYASKFVYMPSGFFNQFQFGLQGLKWTVFFQTVVSRLKLILCFGGQGAFRLEPVVPDMNNWLSQTPDLLNNVWKMSCIVYQVTFA